MQITEIELGTQQRGVDRLKLAYSYETSTAGQSNHDNNGNVLTQTITVPQIGTAQGFTATQMYGYDGLNRLISLTETGGLTQGYSYDQYGNRAVTASSVQSPLLPAQSLSAFEPHTNQLASSMYDAAGNQMRDGAGRTFTYDAENHQRSLNGSAALYSYDGEGKRVKKADQSRTTVFVYDGLGQMVAEYSTAPQANVDTDQTSYVPTDVLGTPRIITGSNGQVKARHDYLPFGEELPVNTASGAMMRTEGQNYVSGLGNEKDKLKQKFTGKERDGESGLDYFGARYYSSSQGKLASPVADDQDFNAGSANSDVTQFDTERRAWLVSSYAAQSLGLNSYPSALPGDLQAWKTGWSEMIGVQR